MNVSGTYSWDISYDIVIERGGLNQVGDWFAHSLGAIKVAIISDNRVAKLYALYRREEP